MITPDQKLVIRAPAGKLPQEEADQKVKVSITIVAGRETLKRILHDLSGVIILQIQAVDHNQVGVITLGEILIQAEDKVHRIREITLPAVRSVLQTVAPEVCHLAARLVQVVVVDRVQGVGINFKKVTYENFERAFARWDCYAFRRANLCAKFC